MCRIENGKMQCIEKSEFVKFKLHTTIVLFLLLKVQNLQFHFFPPATSQCESLEFSGRFKAFDGEVIFNIVAEESDPTEICNYCLAESSGMYSMNSKWFRVEVQPMRDPVDNTQVLAKSVRIIFKNGSSWVDLEQSAIKVIH